MMGKYRVGLRTLIDYLKRYRKYVWMSVAIAVYAVLGFFLAPWLVQQNITALASANFGADLRINRVEVNPFVLSVRLGGFELDDPAGDPVARVEDIFINFQLSSVLRRAWTLSEAHLIGPELFIARDGSGNLNLGYLFGDIGDKTPDTGAPDSSIARMLVFDFLVDNGAVNWRDDVPLDTIETRFGPINIEVEELTTIPNRSGQQSVLITTESTGTLSWTGSLQLAPLKSEGHASIRGSHFPLTSAYIRHQTGFDIIQGDADVDLDYTIESMPDGTIRAAIDDFDLAFNDVVVKTFAGTVTVDAARQQREVLKLPEIRLLDGQVRWPEKHVSVAKVSVDDALVSLYRDESGVLNIDRRSTDMDPGGDELDIREDGGATEADWQIAVEDFAVNHLALSLEDHGVKPVADVGIADFNLSISDISNKPGARFPTSLMLQVRSGGTLNIEGTASVLPEVIFDLDLVIDNLALSGAHPYIKPLADVNMDSGALNVTGQMSRSSEEPISFTGEVDIVDFEITETDEGSRLGSWQRMDASKVAFSMAKGELEISEILLEQPYGDIVIAEDGSINLGRIGKVEGNANADTMDTAEQVGSEKQAEGESGEPQLGVTVGRVVVTQAAADFADYSLPLPFSARIEALDGNMTTISTRSSEPSTVSLEGKVDEYGLVRVTGHITPLDPSANTDLTVSFQNVLVPKFTAYTVPFAGREIASGRLDLTLGYQVADSQLVGENNMVLREFELGDKIPHPDAISLPLSLAVALLKDPDGKIDIDLPVRGDLDDPEFRYGGVILKALANLIVKIVASPFTLLGSLIGVEANELEHINFLTGRSDLTPPELERAAKLAEALALRPELVLEISGVTDADADGLALRTEQLDALVEEGIATLVTAEGNEDMYAEQQRVVLEMLFEDQYAAEHEARLQSLRAQFTTQTVTEQSDVPVTQFDELAYRTELRRQLIDAQPLPETDLANLARERAENTRIAILEKDEALQGRINILESRPTSKKLDEPIQMKVNLSNRSSG